jgi:hypothetical protein
MRLITRGEAVRIRLWQALFLALFFTAFVPAALACEVSARSPAPCSEFDCGKTSELLECSTSGALGSVPMPKEGYDGPKLDHLHSLTLPLLAWNPSQPPQRAYRSRIAPVSPERSTLFGQAVLLLI